MAASMKVASVAGTESEEETLLIEQVQPSAMRRLGFGTAAALLGCAALAATAYMARAAAQERPITAASLLEDPQVIQVATETILAHGQVEPDMKLEMPSSTNVNTEAFAKVAEKMKKVKDSLGKDALEKMGKAKLTKEQKEKMLKQLQAKFSDMRSIAASKTAREAMMQSKAAGESPEAANRRLTEALMPHISDLQSLAEELHPGGLQLDSKSLPVSSAWNPEVSIDFGSPKAPSLRRLSLLGAASSIEASVKSQVRSLFLDLEHELGDDMPKAPARMLTTESDGDSSLINCLMKAAGDHNVAGCVSCMTENMQEVMSMMTKYAKKAVSTVTGKA